ncbi:MAG: hypothetical protein ACI4PG_08360, partial [Candidatus Ventricola sp.]
KEAGHSPKPSHFLVSESPLFRSSRFAPITPVQCKTNPSKPALTVVNFHKIEFFICMNCNRWQDMLLYSYWFFMTGSFD